VLGTTQKASNAFCCKTRLYSAVDAVRVRLFRRITRHTRTELPRQSNHPPVRFQYGVAYLLVREQVVFRVGEPDQLVGPQARELNAAEHLPDVTKPRRPVGVNPAQTGLDDVTLAGDHEIVARQQTTHGVDAKLEERTRPGDAAEVVGNLLPLQQ
jgi:hypothetical protein